MLRHTASRAFRQARGAVATRRSASTVSDSASKVKDAAANLSPVHHKPSSDVPWAIGSLLVFAPTLFWMTSPPSGEKPHAPAPKDKFKPHLRIPDPNASHYKIPEEMGDKAGEGRPHGQGDHSLRAKAEEDEHMAENQGSPQPSESASNHDAKPGLKGNSEKFNAAVRGSQQANQAGGSPAAQDPKSMSEATRAASEDNTGEANVDDFTPDSTAEKVGEKITEQKEKQADAKEDKQADAKEDKKSEE